MLIAALSVIGLNLVKELNTGEQFPVIVTLVRNALLLVLLAVAVARLLRLARRESSTRESVELVENVA
jgi:hypothetical protein